jgi:hypothetical protein
MLNPQFVFEVALSLLSLVSLHLPLGSQSGSRLSVFVAGRVDMALGVLHSISFVLFCFSEAWSIKVITLGLLDGKGERERVLLRCGEAGKELSRVWGELCLSVGCPQWSTPGSTVIWKTGRLKGKGNDAQLQQWRSCCWPRVANPVDLERQRRPGMMCALLSDSWQSSDSKATQNPGTSVLPWKALAPRKMVPRSQKQGSLKEMQETCRTCAWSWNFR